MLLLWIEGVRDKRGIEFWCKICGGGGVVLVTPGWDRGEENQRMGEGRKKASPGRDPFSVVPPLGDPLFTSSITATKMGSAGVTPPSQPAVIYSQ